MKAKKLISSGLKYLLLTVVAAFLALHSINLFRFVFPNDQQYLAWLGFGLTGFGSIAYLAVFLWEGGTVLQKSVALAMAVVCSIGEVLAAIFGMMIESWEKAGFTLTENDFQTMLLVVGILSIAHFIALIVYFAGDKIGELFADADGDGIPNYRDRDYKPKHQKPTSSPQKPQNKSSSETPRRWWQPADLFAEFDLDAEGAKAKWGGGTYQEFAGEVSKAVDISGKNMRSIYEGINPTEAARRSNHR